MVVIWICHTGEFTWSARFIERYKLEEEKEEEKKTVSNQLYTDGYNQTEDILKHKLDIPQTWRYILHIAYPEILIIVFLIYET
mgnify:FL=1